MKPVVKIIILCILIFALSIFAAKKSIDYTFQKVECSQTTQTTALDFKLASETL